LGLREVRYVRTKEKRELSSLRKQGPITIEVCCYKGRLPNHETDRFRGMGPRLRGDDKNNKLGG